MKAKRLLALVLAATMVFALAGCVDQHPDTQEDTDADTENPRLVATSPAVAQICNRLELDLVGVSRSSSRLSRTTSSRRIRWNPICSRSMPPSASSPCF